MRSNVEPLGSLTRQEVVATTYRPIRRLFLQRLPKAKQEKETININQVLRSCLSNWIFTVVNSESESSGCKVQIENNIIPRVNILNKSWMRHITLALRKQHWLAV